MGKDIIYTVEDAKFTIGEKSFGINNVTMNLSLNSIPEVIVIIPPHEYDSKGYNVGSPGLYDIHKLMDEMYELADKDTRCNLYIELKSDERTQKIDIKNWILSDVSLGSASTTSGFYITCKIKHPAYLLSRKGNFAGCLDEPLDFEVISGRDGPSDIIDAADRVLDKILESPLRECNDIPTDNIPHASSYKQIEDDIKARVKDLCDNYKPSNFLKFDPSFFSDEYEDKNEYDRKPLSTICENAIGVCDMVSARDNALCASVVPQVGGSVWDAILQANALFGSVIVPTYYDDKLIVAPSSPWAGFPLRILESSSVHSISLPAYDADPILGVVCPTAILGPGADALAYKNQAPAEDTTQSVIVYMPTGNIEALHGRFLTIGTPPWFDIIAQQAASAREENMGGDGDSGSGVSAGQTKSLYDFLQQSQLSFAAYVFQQKFKQSYSASIVAPLMILDDWHEEPGPLVPGATLSILDHVEVNRKGTTADDDDGSRYVLGGYIISVTHSISVESSVASTTITLGYCRGLADYPGIAETGDLNPLYISSKKK